MKTIELIKKIRLDVINENNEVYKELFETTSINDVTDSYWKENNN